MITKMAIKQKWRLIKRKKKEFKSELLNSGADSNGNKTNVNERHSVWLRRLTAVFIASNVNAKQSTTVGILFEYLWTS